MATTLDLGTMTTVEKLRLMEDLWQSLSADGQKLDSPDWHGDVLAERDRLIESGEEKYVDWEIAKKQLRAELQ
jgi:hypothetical protein